MRNVLLFLKNSFTGLGAPPQESKNSHKRTIVKKHICSSIFSSHYFELRRVESVDVDNIEVRTQLKNNYQEIFESIFKRYQKWGPFITDYKYVNAYKIIEIGETKREYVFQCLVKDSQSRIQRYFVTQHYNVNIVANAPPIFGRFIFDGSMLLALAEEAAILANSMQAAEHQYALSRTYSQLSKD